MRLYFHLFIRKVPFIRKIVL